MIQRWSLLTGEILLFVKCGNTVDLVNFLCPKFDDMANLPTMITYGLQILKSSELLHIDTIMLSWYPSVD